jgi:hypothetical protein
VARTLEARRHLTPRTVIVRPATFAPTALRQPAEARTNQRRAKAGKTSRRFPF